MITAPYNFVPLNKKVFYPDWDKDISHDMPFEDGESGMIGITITAMSPIYIRNHYANGDDFYESKNGDKISTEFCHMKQEDGSKQYYIPGSTLKGMTRSVLEILSFSKIKFMEDAILNVRDMTNQKALVGSGKNCGFLVKTDGGYYIEDCGKPRSISFSEVQKATGKEVRKLKTAADKYKLIGIIDIPIRKDKKIMTNYKGDKIPKDIALWDENATLKARLVLTGTINNKKNEFVFVKNDKIIELDEESTKVVHRFKKAYFHDDSTDGKFWEKHWKRGEPIPVFYSKDKEGNIEHIGLTQLFKLGYTKSLAEAAKQDTEDDSLDLAECIFGTEDDKKALKGRVQFSHLKSSHVTFEKEKSEILGEPNPTYYPNYIRQTNTRGDKVNSYKTLMNDDAQISGWKRYPLHESISTSKGGNDNDDVRSKFKPLSTQSVFEGKIRFHNLKKAEIGALLSAITFHGQEASHMHNIGMAKSLGYGKIKIDLTLDKHLVHTQSQYLEAFESTIAKEIDGWRDTLQLKELFTMSNVETKSNKNLEYQLLENPTPKYKMKNGRSEANDFTGAKKEKEYLLPHSVGASKKTIQVNNTNKTRTTVPRHSEQPKPTTLKTANSHVKIYSIKEIATLTHKTVQEVIDFSVGLHFGKLHDASELREPQAKDLIKRITATESSQKVAENTLSSVVLQEDTGISKTLMRKTIMSYWQETFGVMYHRNQIREFLSEEGFVNTPVEQQTLYEAQKDNESFVKFCKVIHLFEFGEMSEESKEKLYAMLTR